MRIIFFVYITNWLTSLWKFGHYRGPDGYFKGNIWHLGLKLFNSAMESKDVIAEEQASLNKIEAEIKLDFKITIYKKERETLGWQIELDDLNI